MAKIAIGRRKEINKIIRMPSSPGSTDSSSPQDTSDEETHDVYDHSGTIQGLDGKGEKLTPGVCTPFFLLVVVVAAVEDRKDTLVVWQAQTLC